jgi:hypothetical protein
MYNNMISLTPTSNNNLLVVGIMDQVRSPYASEYYHNTVYIGGTGANSLSASAAYVHWPNRGVAITGGEVTVRNNVFIMDRTSQTNVYAMSSRVNGQANLDSDYNLLISSVAGQTAAWDGTAGTFAQWQSNSAGEANSNYASVINGSPSTDQSINLTELFVDVLSDLHLIASEEEWPLAWVENRGTTLEAVEEDIDGEPRNTDAPTLGADEFYVEICLEPSVEITTTVHVVCEGDDLVISSDVSGTSLVMQWQVKPAGSNEWAALTDGDDYSGVSTNELTITAASLAMNGNQYRIALTNNCGDANAEVTITVNASMTYYADEDGDGKGDINSTLQACEQPVGYVTNSSDCDDEDALVWLAKPVEISFTLNPTVCVDADPFELNQVEPSNGTWSGMGVSNGMFSAETVGLGVHVLSYFVAGDGMCSLPATSTIALEVITCTFMDEVDTQAIALYPNRVETTFRIEADALQQLIILDMNGRVLESTKIQGNSYQHDMTSYAAGAYFVRVVTPYAVQVFKVTKIG